MKLDRLKLASLIGFLSCRYALTFTQDDIREADEIIDFEVPTQQANEASCNDVNELLRQLNKPDGFIPAIRVYRVLTGAGLKESKEAIERYRSIPNFPKKDEPASEFKVDPKAATLGDILGHATGQRY